MTHDFTPEGMYGHKIWMNNKLVKVHLQFCYAFVFLFGLYVVYDFQKCLFICTSLFSFVLS